MQRLALLLALPAAAALAAFALRASAEDGAPARVVEYRVLTAEGSAAPEADVSAAAAAVTTRLARAGFEGVTVLPDAAASRVRLSCAAEAGESLDAIRRLVERPGRVEFRLRARERDEERRRAESSAEGGGAALPPDLAWAKRADGAPPFLVETPERATALAVDRLRARGLAEDAEELKAARAAHERVVAREVFTGAEIVRSERTRRIKRNGAATALCNCLEFEFAEARKHAFEEFTRAGQGRDLVVILDGEAVLAFAIRDALPGAGSFSAATHVFSDETAATLDAVLASGPLRVRLEAVATEAPK